MRRRRLIRLCLAVRVSLKTGSGRLLLRQFKIYFICQRKTEDHQTSSRGQILNSEKDLGALFEQQIWARKTDFLCPIRTYLHGKLEWIDPICSKGCYQIEQVQSTGCFAYLIPTHISDVVHKEWWRWSQEPCPQSQYSWVRGGILDIRRTWPETRRAVLPLWPFTSFHPISRGCDCGWGVCRPFKWWG